MIKAAGIGVAVDNALDEVKAAADEIAQSNDNDGVAHFIENLLLL
jgi:hydroxymethylpyrimidine pyrophosphatase-like HAD family hydrolase